MPGGAGHHRGASKQDFATPEIFVAAALVKLGIAEFMFDFAADAGNAVCSCYWDAAVDSLRQPRERWLEMVVQEVEAGWGWLNPPFDRIAKWAAAMAALREDEGRCAFLVPAAVGSRWWADSVHGTARVLLLQGRIPFDPSKPHWGYPKDMALCLYSPTVNAAYELWDWRQDVPAELMAAHKSACQATRAAEAVAKKAARLATTQ